MAEPRLPRLLRPHRRRQPRKAAAVLGAVHGSLRDARRRRARRTPGQHHIPLLALLRGAEAPEPGPGIAYSPWILLVSRLWWDKPSEDERALTARGGGGGARLLSGGDSRRREWPEQALCAGCRRRACLLAARRRPPSLNALRGGQRRSSSSLGGAWSESGQLAAHGFAGDRTAARAAPGAAGRSGHPAPTEHLLGPTSTMLPRCATRNCFGVPRQVRSRRSPCLRIKSAPMTARRCAFREIAIGGLAMFDQRA